MDARPQFSSDRDSEPVAPLFARGLRAPDHPRLRARAAWIAGGYALIATGWIYLSDGFIAWLGLEPALIVRWSVFKGVAFVSVTALLLLLVLWSAFRAIETGYAALRARTVRLRANETRLDTILRSASDAVVAIDERHRIVLFNAAAERLFLCPEAEALGAPVSRFLPDDFTLSESPLHRLEGLRADGTRIQIEAACSSMHDGETVLFTLILRDISARLAQEAESDRLRRLYAALSQINQAIVWSRTRDELFQKVCDALVANGVFRMCWVGWHEEASHRLLPVASAGDSDGYARDIRVFTDDRPEGRGPSGTAFREGRPYVCNDLLADPATLPWRKQAERRGHRSSAVFPIRLETRACGTLNVYADTTDFFQTREIALLEEAATDISFALDNLARERARREAEERALNEKRFSDAMIESMPGVLYFFDAGGRFLRWNRNFETVTGRAAGEIAAMHPREFFAPADQPAIEARIAEVFANGEADIEAPLLTRGGVAVPYFFTGRRIEFQGRVCLVGVGLDVSERTRAVTALRELNDTLELRVAERTDELRDALRRAESADRLKSAFLATMSHELRTPLNSIIGFTGILLQHLAGPLNPEQTKQLGMVQTSARHLLELINDVLDLSKIEAGQLTLRHEPFDLRAVVDHALATIRPLAGKKDLALSLAFADDVPALTGDARRVGQILLNLLNNAVKFTDQGRVSLIVERASLAAAPAVRLIVRDTGPGIRTEDLARLFQPFRQLDSGLDRQHEGTGLGLAICRRLAALMGGTIEVSSVWSQGSDFIVTLPVAPQSPSSPTP